MPAGLSRYLTGKFIWNPDENDAEKLLAGLHVIGEKIGTRSIIIPTNDYAAILIEEHAKLLERWFLFPTPRVGLSRSLADKQRLMEICCGAGVESPKTYVSNSYSDVGRLVEQFEFPVIVKIAEPWQRPRPKGLNSTTVASNAAELQKILCIAEGPPRTTLLIQECIPSKDGVDAMFAGYCNDRSSCLVGLTGEKIRSYPPFAGMTSASRSTNDPDLRSLAEALLGRIGFSGIVDLEFRRDERDGKLKLLDFNPRVGAQFRLYETSAGIDVVRAMHLDLTGRQVPRSEGVSHRVFIVENYEARVFWSYRRTRALTVREWFRSLRGKRVFAWFGRDDLLPFMGMCARLAFTYIRNRLGIEAASDDDQTGPPIYIRGRGA